MAVGHFIRVFLMVAMASTADGFSVHDPKRGATAPRMGELTPPTRSSIINERRVVGNVPNFPSTTLYLSDVSSSVEPSITGVTEEEDDETELLNEILAVVEQQPQHQEGGAYHPDESTTHQSIWPPRTATILQRQIDWNEVINTSLIVLISMVVLVKLTTVNAGMTRGWSPEEIGARMALDNWDGYLTVLRESPVATKAVTSATVYTMGDVIAQRTEGSSMGTLDRPRILRSLLAGLIGHGPLSHYWYEISEDFFNNALQLTTQWWAFLPKVAIDQTLWGPFWNNTYILLLGLMKRESLESIWEDVKRTTVPLVVSGLKLWPLAHCVTYGVIPVENRLLWVDMVEIVWVTILATQAAGATKKEDPKQQQQHPALSTSADK